MKCYAFALSFFSVLCGSYKPQQTATGRVRGRDRKISLEQQKKSVPRENQPADWCRKKMICLLHGKIRHEEEDSDRKQPQ
jgi:hypothetical protein